MNNFTIKQNVVIKNMVPISGITCSNPERAMRIVRNNLEDVVLHTSSWGIVVHTGRYKNEDVFIASVPMGAAGSGFAFHELFAAGAKKLIRYGSNDYNISHDQLYDVSIAEKADNLYGLMKDNGLDYDILGQEIGGSIDLFHKLVDNFKNSEINKINTVTCHNIEDYHAFNNPDLLSSTNKKNVLNILEKISRSGPGAWDMETAALYLKAKQFNANAITVLQSIIKKDLLKNPYDEDFKSTIVKIESIISKGCLDSLV